jgi:hypothetical protein
MSRILLNQNKPENIEKLSTQRNLYSKAKKIQTWQIILTIIMPILFSFLALNYPLLSNINFVYGTLMLFISFIFLCFIQKIKEQAAKVQELFDCSVLNLNWNTLKCGDKPTLEFIHQNKEDKKTIKRLKKLTDWYTTNIKGLPISIGRILCQFENCLWDSKLRKRYSFYLLGSVISLFLIMLFIGFLRQLTLLNFFLFVFIPISPAFVFCFTEVKEHIDTNIATKRIKSEIEKVIKLSKEKRIKGLKLRSRNIQDEIYERRKKSPLIPDWIYEKLRDSYENDFSSWIKEISKELRNTYI